MQNDQSQTRSAAAVASSDLLGGGGDLTGRLVEYWGRQWIISGKNYTGDWDVVRFEKRVDATIKIESSIAHEVLPCDHPHYAELLPPPNAPDQRPGEAPKTL